MYFIHILCMLFLHISIFIYIYVFIYTHHKLYITIICLYLFAKSVITRDHSAEGSCVTFRQTNNIWGFPENRGYPNSWMVHKGKSHQD